MPDFVEIAVVFALYFSILLGRNDNVYSGRKRESNDFRCVIATICQKILGVYSLDKVYRYLAGCFALISCRHYLVLQFCWVLLGFFVCSIRHSAARSVALPLTVNA